MIMETQQLIVPRALLAVYEYDSALIGGAPIDASVDVRWTASARGLYRAEADALAEALAAFVLSEGRE